MYAWGTLGTRGLRVCGGMGEVELLALYFKCTLRRGVFSHFSVLLSEVHFPCGEHHFLQRAGRSRPLKPAREHPLICKLANRVSHKVEGLIQGLKETMESI